MKNIETKTVDAVAVLIPSYQPGPQLLKLLNKLSRNFAIIIVINDGSSTEEAKATLAEASEYENVRVVNHDYNKGKGAAIKTGIEEVLTKFHEIKYIVTADADGQHRSQDIVNVARSLKNKFRSDLVMGVRTFERNIPFRSYFGNILTSKIFKYAYGTDLPDTQTGLRGFNCEIAKSYLDVPENGYEFETSSLIKCIRNNIPISEVQITTVYLDGNSSSHFNPLIDSIKIYRVLLYYVAIAVFSALVDFFLFLALVGTYEDIFFASVVARLVSGSINFSLNRSMLNSQNNLLLSIAKYLTVFFAVMMFSAQSVIYLSNIGVPIGAAKILTDVVLFFAVFKVRKLIY